MGRIRARVKMHEVSANALTPIARWDVVPYQRINTTFKAGVVAFSKEGVEKVTFSVTDGVNTTTYTASSMTLNDRVSVYEYWVTIDPADFDDGEITMSATVVGDDGGTNVLADLTMVANSGGTVAQPEIWVDSATGNDSTGTVGNQGLPCLTIDGAAVKIQAWMASAGHGTKGDGGIVYLEQGDHDWGTGPGTVVSVENEWLTVTLAVGGDKTNTRIVSYNTTGVQKIKVDGVYCWFDHSNWTGNSEITGIFGRPGWPDYDPWHLWLDNGEASADNRWEWGAYVSRYSTSTSTQISNFYATDSHFHDLRTLCEGAMLLRGLTIERVGDDAMHGVAMVVNSTADTIDPGIVEFGVNVTFTAPSTVTRTDGGSWVTAGWTVGMTFQISSSADNNALDGVYTIASVSATAIVLNESGITSGDDTADFAQTFWHADGWQYWSFILNDIIVYNYSVTNLGDQGIMADSSASDLKMDNVAFVNVFFQKAETLDRASGSILLWQLSTEHFLLWNCTFDRAGSDKGKSSVAFLGKGGFDKTLTDFSMRNCVTTSLVVANEVTLVDAVVDNNHFLSADWNGEVIDTNTTTGDALLGNDGVPGVGSDAIDRVTGTALVPVDLSNPVIARTSPSNIGAFET